MFNLRQEKRAQADTVTEKQLDHSENDKVGPTLEGLLKDDHKDITNQIIEKHLDEERKENTADQSIEALIDEVDKNDEYPQRNGKDEFDMNPVNVNTAINDAKRDENFLAATKSSDKDLHWDKLVAETQFLKEPIKAAPSQLHNNVDRFVGKKLDVGTDSGIKKMVMASLEDADAMIYYIYRQASEQDRELTQEESDFIAQINQSKVNVLMQLK